MRRPRPAARVGWKGCTVFDCFGAGRQVSQVTFGGVSWRDAPGTAGTMYAVLPVMRQLHEMLSHLRAALAMSPGAAVEGELAALLDEVEDLTAATPDVLLALDLTGLRARVGPLLQRASAAVRAEARRAGRAPKTPPRRVQPGADLLGVDLHASDLRAADLRGAYLIAADLRGCDLGATDLLGADLRDADLRDAEPLRRALPHPAAARRGPGERADRHPALAASPGLYGPDRRAGGTAWRGGRRRRFRWSAGDRYVELAQQRDDAAP